MQVSHKCLKKSIAAGPKLEKICRFLHRLVLKGEKGRIHLASMELPNFRLLLQFGWQMSRGEISPATCSLHSSQCAQSGRCCRAWRGGCCGHTSIALTHPNQGSCTAITNAAKSYHEDHSKESILKHHL